MAVKLLIYPPEHPELPNRLRAAVPDATVVVATDEAAAIREIADADALYGRITPELLAAAGRLRWIQSPAIGLERTMFPELIAHPVVMTNPRGIFADDIADHVMAMVTGFARQFPRLIRWQLRHQWRQEDYPVLHLPDCTLGIFGLGGIGSAIARRASAFEMRVIAVDARRTEAPPEVATLLPPERLNELLGASDFVVISAPETPETRGLFGSAVFQAMKNSAYLINIGRGKIVQLDALVEALRAGKIAGAGLDVFEIEPLPAEHPLWDMENVVITPHVAGFGPHTGERRHQVLIENLRRFAAGEPLLNLVEKDRWF
ncbi:MAG TPA: D-2-hydroxyacid dehydrogenase [Chloroflexota bacterium]|nr:D-2-hydroxyacid dehydrogenase [Chloroflexota bacterium]